MALLAKAPVVMIVLWFGKILDAVNQCSCPVAEPVFRALTDRLMIECRTIESGLDLSGQGICVEP